MCNDVTLLVHVCADDFVLVHVHYVFVLAHAKCPWQLVNMDVKAHSVSLCSR